MLPASETSFDDPEFDDQGDDALRIRDLTSRAVGAFIAVCPLGLPEDARISFHFTRPEMMAALNSRWRGVEAPTNVLSFPTLGADSCVSSPVLGDVAISLAVCRAEAAQSGKPFADHLSHLVAHGLLHLIGCDHETDGDRKEMLFLEARILARLDVPDPRLAQEYQV